MFWNTWGALGRVLVIGLLAYMALMLLLRISGKRTLTKLNAFDLVVTVSLGSTLASVLISKSVSLAEGGLAFAALIALQLAVTWSSVHSALFQWLVKAEPTLLLHHVRFLDRAMVAERVTREELLAVLRASGKAEPAAVAAVVLETDGLFSVLSDKPSAGLGTLSNIPYATVRG